MKKFLSIALLSIVLITSCNKEEDTSSTISANDFSKSINENQIINTVIGTINATSTDGTLSYSIENQYPIGAIAINTVSGEITVADASAFDFETNPTITATVTIEGSTITETSDVTITLNDIDDLESLLSDSKSAYTAASNGDWIEITEAEYNKLEAEINEVSRIGTTEAEYDATHIGNSGAQPFTTLNKGATIEENSYVFAFKYYIHDGTNVAGFKIKQSETENTGYTDLGSELPTHSGTTTSVYFVLKENTTTYTAESFLGFYKPEGCNLGYNNTSGIGYYYLAGDNNTNLTSFNRGLLFYQSLTTTQKQW